MRMEFFEVVKRRKSVRKYTGKPIEKATIEKIVAAGIQAPYGTGEEYPVRYVAVTSKEAIKAVYDGMAAQDWHRFVLDAAALIVVALRTDIKGGVADAHASCENMLLAATALGLGACWIGAFNPEKVRDALALLDKHKVIAVLSIGPPAEDPEVVARPPVKDVLTYK
jgi:nitroreductase